MSAVAPLVAGRYFGCTIPDAELKIQLNPDVISQLGAAVMEGFKRVPRRGLEVGGLLLGRVDDGCVVVEAFEAVPSEHERGPSWLLSEKDKGALSEAVARANGSGKETHVVGLFRSQTRAGFAAVEEDAALMKEYCDGAGHVFLLVKPEGAGQSTALFAAREGLRATSEVFPFRASPPVSAPRAETPRAEASRPTANAEPAPQPGPAAARIIEHVPTFEHVPRLQVNRVLAGYAAEQKGSPDTAPRRGRPLIRTAWTAAILLAAAACGYGLAKWWVQPPPAAEAHTAGSLSLHAKWTGANLDLEWDRNAPLIRHANGAVLWIDDGPKHRRLDLALDELTQGSIQYWPTSGDVSFRLEVFTPDAKASESVRTVSLPIPEPAAAVEARDQLPPAKAPRRTADPRRPRAALRSGPGNS